VYDINVLRHSGSEKEITKNMVDEAKELDLDNDVTEGNKGRLSLYEPNGVKPGNEAAAPKEGTDSLPDDDVDQTPAKPDVVIEDIGDEPINLDDIPF
jgi:hypothetical protein